MSIIHYTAVDFTRRVISEPVHIVQGDRTLPTLAVELLSDGQPYTVPDGAQVNIALDKKDGTFVLNKADSVDGNIATFTITAQMAAVPGDFTPEVQIVDDSGQATTGKFPYIVDKAEIQEGMIESTSEGTALIAYVSRAEEAAEKAEKVQSQIDSVTVNTEAAAKSAKEAAESAIVSATNADLAKASATAAKTSETAAKAHLESVQEEHSDITSEISAANTAIRASVTEAKDYSIVSRSYAEGGTGTRDGEDTANARYYMEQAQKAASGAGDDALSTTSKNWVQNKVVTAALVEKASNASISAINTQISTLSDMVAAKADTASVNEALAEKQDSGDYATNADLAKKADGLSYADSKLQLLSGTTVLSEAEIESGSASLQIKITFDENFKGNEYTITGGSESYSGTVPDSLVVIQKVKSYNTTYTVTSTSLGSEYTATVATGQYSGEYTTTLNTFTATITVSVTASAKAASGATVKATTGTTTYTGTTDSTGSATITVHQTGDYTISATYGEYTEATGDSVTILAEGDAKTSAVALFGAMLTITADVSSATGTGTNTVTVAGGGKSWTKDITETSTFSYTLYTKGEYTVNMTNGTDTAAETKVDVQTDGNDYTADVSYLKIVSWADGTDEEIAAMVAAADKGSIDLTKYWAIGQERKVNLSAMAATGVGESHAAQTVTFVLMDKDHFELSEATSGGKTRCSFVVGQKEMLNENGYMNSSNTNSGGWDATARRTWCNNVYYNALPSALKPIFKKFKNNSASGSGTSAQKTSEDYFSLFSEMEIFGTLTYANATGEANNTQIEYYKTTANRTKTYANGGSYNYWWERSACSADGNYFCIVSSGTANDSGASNTRGLAPFGCV